MPPTLEVGMKRSEAWKDTTLAPVVLDYLAYLRRRRCSPHTVRTREKLLIRLCEAFDGRRIEELSGKQGTRMLERWLDGMRHHQTGEALRPQTLGTYISSLKAFFSWCYDEELILHDPARRLERPEVGERNIRLYTREEVARLKTMQTNTMDTVGVWLIFEFALRREDIRLLQIRDIDLDGRTVLFKHGKGGTVRRLPFRNQECYELVREYLLLERRDADPEEYVLHARKKVRLGSYDPDAPNEGYRYEWRGGNPLEPYTHGGIYEWWERVCDTARVPKERAYTRRIHDARHTTGTELAGSTENPKKVQLFLRHRSQQSTDLYIHWNETEVLREEFGWEAE
jgi:integrase